MAGLFLVAGACFFARPAVWLVAVPGLLPIIGLAPWTGWITVEELDLLVLAAAAGGYARLAWRPAQAEAPLARGSRTNALVWFVVALFAASTLVAMARGVADAGGLSWGWYQGYHEPMNSLRLAKPLFLALLLIPLWRSAVARDPGMASSRLMLGLLLGLLGASLAAVWERMAYTGLLNFSSDYRTTALFWEMHVGGAALDGFLAMTVPFVAYALLTEQKHARWAAFAAIAAIAGYACLTTFSRGVYLAVPIGMALTFGLYARGVRRGTHGRQGAMASPDGAGHGTLYLVLPALFLLAVFAAGAGWMFRSSGYRGMLALLGAMTLVLLLPALLQRFRLADWLAGVVLGAVFCAAAVAGAWLLPKGAYIVYTLAFAATAAAFLAAHRRHGAAAQRGNPFAPLALAGFLSVLASVPLVAQHWGDAAGLRDALVAAGGVLLCAALAAKPGKPVWPVALRWQAMVLGAMVMLASLVGVFAGGAYMTDRFSTGSKDLGGRVQHWSEGLAALSTSADVALGKGLGRFPSTHFFAETTKEHPGDYRLATDGRNSYLILTAGQHITGWGEILRVSQRIDVPAAPAMLVVDVRSAGEVSLHAEVCEKHLLYNEGCLIKQARSKPLPGEWQRLQIELGDNTLSRGSWYAPKFIMFSVAVSSRGGRADLDNLTLTDAGGRQLLANGDFSQGMAHWFFSSDRHHMPWHIKGAPMNVLFDQGVVGLVLWLALFAGALWRVSLGHARGHALAPPLAGALVGFFVVGLFDSLLDVPRIAFLFYFLLLLCLTIRPPRAPVPAGTAGASVPAPRRGATAASAWLATALLIGMTASSDDAAATTATSQDGTGPAAARAEQRVLRVGPTRAIQSMAQAARLARPGDTVAVDAGEYVGDVAVWTQDNLTLRAVGGRVRLLAAGAAAEGKGIWVVRAANFSVEGFDFQGAAVAGRNGAGIRFDKGSLRVRDCSFTYNEMGLLTGNDPDATLDVENSEFAHNARPDGHNHNLYVGQIARLRVQGSYLHHARTGHLLKSRAALNHILYNRLTDEPGGSASYELEFPNGGVAYVIGNIIEQGAFTENPHLISFGAEGYKWPAQALYLVHNTLIDNKPEAGIFLRVAPGAVTLHATNNLLVGAGKLELGGPGRYEGNAHAGREALDLASPAATYRLQPGSAPAGKAVDPGQANGQKLMPLFEYVHPRSVRPLDGPAHNPGAMQSMARPSP